MCCDSTALVITKGGQFRFNGDVATATIWTQQKRIHIGNTTGNPITINSTDENNDHVLLIGTNGTQIELHDEVNVVKMTVDGNHFVVRVNIEPITKEKNLTVTMNGEEVNPRKAREEDPIYWAAYRETPGRG